MEEDKSVEASQRQLLEMEDRSAVQADADFQSSSRAGDKGEHHVETLEDPAIPATSANEFAYLNARKSI